MINRLSELHLKQFQSPSDNTAPTQMSHLDGRVDGGLLEGNHDGGHGEVNHLVQLDLERGKLLHNPFQVTAASNKLLKN